MRRYRPITHTREQLEAEYGSVYDVQALAAEFILIGIDCERVTVRRKLDGELGTFRYHTSPLYFFEFRSGAGAIPRSQAS